MTKRSPARAQDGFSLVELMVAITIGLIIVLVLIQVLISNRAGNRLQDNLTRLQEDGRFAVELISRVIRMNGYQGDTANEWLLGPLSAANGGLTPLDASDNDTNGMDTIRATYSGTADGFVRDCHGNVVPAGTRVMNRFSVSAANELQCAVSTDDGATWQTLVIIDRVEGLHLLYGVDTNGDGAANQYVTAPNVADMETVVSVRVGLLLVTRDDFIAAGVDSRDYLLLDETLHAGAAAPGDRRMRRVVSATINLRNHT